MITREELLRTKEWWIIAIQNDLFNLLRVYMEENNLNQTQLADKLGVTKGYISQILNGDFDHRISKLVEISIAIGKAPIVKFEGLDEIVGADKNNHSSKPMRRKKTAPSPLRAIHAKV